MRMLVKRCSLNSQGKLRYANNYHASIIQVEDPNTISIFLQDNETVQNTTVAKILVNC